MSEEHSTVVKIVRTDVEKRQCFGLVYAPNVLDTWGEMMLPSDVRLMAQRFMQTVKMTESIDVQHSEKATECYPIESFIARAGDPDYSEGSWVVGVQIVGDDLWKAVKSKKINGFSFQCLVRKVPAIVEVEVEQSALGETDTVDNHSHLFYVEVNDDGLVVGGRTSVVNGHSHEIFGATTTEKAAGHSHCFFV